MLSYLRWAVIGSGDKKYSDFESFQPIPLQVIIVDSSLTGFQLEEIK